MDDETRESIALLTARVLGMRDIVVRLLAYEAKRFGDSETLLKSF